VVETLKAESSGEWVNDSENESENEKGGWLTRNQVSVFRCQEPRGKGDGKVPSFLQHTPHSLITSGPGYESGVKASDQIR
jgi:hypothetical protein